MARNAQLSPRRLAEVARLFGVLAEPTRLRILQRLRRGPAPVGGLAAALHLGQSNVSKHLTTLHDAGLIHRRRRGNVIECEIADPLVFELCNLVCGKLRRDAGPRGSLPGGTQTSKR